MSTAPRAGNATLTATAGTGTLGVGLALAALYLVWGSTYLAIRVALEGFPPFLMAGGRFLLAGAILYTFSRARGERHPSRAEWRGAAIVGILLLALGNGGVVLAEKTVASGVAAIAVAVVPVWTALFAGLWGRWPARAEWFGLAAGLAGVVILNLDGGLRASPSGAIVLIVAPLCWALGTVWSRHLTLPTGLMSSAAQMLAGGAVLIVVSLAFGERVTALPDLRSSLALAYLTVFGSIITFSAYAYLVQRVRPTLATSYAYVNPVVAVALGALFAGERVGTAAIVALPLILAGVAVIAAARGRKEVKA